MRSTSAWSASIQSLNYLKTSQDSQLPWSSSMAQAASVERYVREPIPMDSRLLGDWSEKAFESIPEIAAELWTCPRSRLPAPPRPGRALSVCGSIRVLNTGELAATNNLVV